MQTVFFLNIVSSDLIDMRNKKRTSGKEVLAGLDRSNMMTRE